MTLVPPSAGDPYSVPSAPSEYAAPSPSAAGPSWPGAPGQPTAPRPPAPRARPSWVAWVALGLSALSLVIATSIGIIYAANSLSTGDATESEEGFYYDAGMPAWGSVELTATGDVDEMTLEASVDQYLKEGIEDFDGSAEDVSEVDCEAMVQPKKDSVGTCSVVIQDVDSTVVLVFLNDEGAYLATLY